MRETLTAVAEHLPPSQRNTPLELCYAPRPGYNPIGFLVDEPSQERKTIYPRSRGQCL